MVDGGGGEFEDSDSHDNMTPAFACGDDEVEAFFMANPVSPTEIENVASYIEESLRKVIQRCRQDPKEWKHQQQRPNRDDVDVVDDDDVLTVGIENDTITSDITMESELKSIIESARAYQNDFVEMAKERNIIVHLGTGTGKTLIAVLLIKHYLEIHPEKMVVFLVPSHALAIQQSDTLRANLDYAIETAMYPFELKPPAQRLEEYRRCKVLVATHGAMKNLLSFYKDKFCMSNVSLLILDECHNCVKKSDYATIMRDFYHKCPIAERPRVLGLTASPLINHKSKEGLEDQLQDLERTTDCHVMSVRDLGCEDSSLLFKEAEEKAIEYMGQATTLPEYYPSADPSTLLESRKKELNQLEELYKDLGPYVVALYCRLLCKGLKRDRFEHETEEQFAYTLEFLKQLEAYCEHQWRHDHESRGRTRKLLDLEDLLRKEIKERADAVGVVFVRMRATALALQEYFRLENEDEQRLPQSNDNLEQDEWYLPTEEVRIDGDATTVSSLTPDVASAIVQQSKVVAAHSNVGSSTPTTSVSDGFRKRQLGNAEGMFDDADADPGCTTAPFSSVSLGEVASVVGNVAVGNDDVSRHSDKKRGVEVSGDFGQFADSEDDPFSPPVPHLPIIQEEPPVTQDANYESQRDTHDSGDQFSDAESEEDETKRAAIGLFHLPPSAPTFALSASSVGVSHLPDLSAPSAPAQLSTSSLPRIQSFTSSQATQRAGNLNEEPIKEPIKSGVLVGRASSVFNKALRSFDSLSDEEKEDLSTELRNQEERTREVLNQLRRGEINVLIATSVVEEGVDVKACSFVAAFDPLESTKSYVQMKGRARQQNAKFFAFESASGVKTPLEDAQRKERDILNFLSARDSMTELSWSDCVSARDPDHSASQAQEKAGNVAGIDRSAELEALEQGRFDTLHALVTTQNSVSLLYRIIMAQPMDPDARFFKQSLVAYMPSFDSRYNRLCLPASIGTRANRDLILPESMHEKKRNEKKSLLALMACVRLYKLGLLSKRLQPPSKEHVIPWILKCCHDEAKQDFEMEPPVRSPTSFPSLTLTSDAEFYVYRIIQESETVSSFQQVLSGEHTQLAIISQSSLDTFPGFIEKHRELGNVILSLKLVDSYTPRFFSAKQLEILSSFFEVLFDARWKRKTGKTKDSSHRCVDHNTSSSCSWFPYRVCCVDSDGEPQWGLMSRIISESKRSRKERKVTISELKLSEDEGLLEPRLWCPLWNESTSYIVYGSTKVTCDAAFPHTREGEATQTYRDYFEGKKNYRVDKNSRLCLAQRLWRLPCRRPLEEPAYNSFVDTSISQHGYKLCEGLACAMLPKEACIEKPMANPSLLLASTFLPQVLYNLERQACAGLFISHCAKGLPKLASFLSSLPLEDVVNVLSARSCNEKSSYERLEWLGDGVLKLILSDVIMKSTDLHPLIANVHEGLLDLFRSVMGSNQRLENTCKRLGIDSFILTSALGRVEWSPGPLELVSPNESQNHSKKANRPTEGKICADVIEALLGLVYLHKGYQFALDFATELNLTIPWQEYSFEQVETSQQTEAVNELVESLTSYQFSSLHPLLTEALTHPTALNPETPSYQRLEWLGDAVLCLAARKWIFDHFPEADVKTMGMVESTLVSNETLAFLSLRKGLYKYVNHADPTLPGRIASYEWSVRDGEGLWGTDPPKAIADVVESVIGAVHIHGGFVRGQQGALKVLEPVTELILRANEDSINKLLHHPKNLLMEAVGGGKFISISVVEEGKYASENPELLVWSRMKNQNECVHYLRAAPAHRAGHRAIASVDCRGVNLVTVAADTRSPAKNRACELVLSVLNRNPELRKSLQEARVETLHNQARENRDDDDKDESDQDDDYDDRMI